MGAEASTSACNQEKNHVDQIKVYLSSSDCGARSCFAGFRSIVQPQWRHRKRCV